MEGKRGRGGEGRSFHSYFTPPSFILSFFPFPNAPAINEPYQGAGFFHETCDRFFLLLLLSFPPPPLLPNSSLPGTKKKPGGSSSSSATNAQRRKGKRRWTGKSFWGQEQSGVMESLFFLSFFLSSRSQDWVRESGRGVAEAAAAVSTFFLLRWKEGENWTHPCRCRTVVVHYSLLPFFGRA